MLDPSDISTIRQLVRVEVENAEMIHHSGTYNFLCSINGIAVLTHRPIGTVLRRL